MVGARNAVKDTSIFSSCRGCEDSMGDNIAKGCLRRRSYSLNNHPENFCFYQGIVWCEVLCRSGGDSEECIVHPTRQSQHLGICHDSKRQLKQLHMCRPVVASSLLILFLSIHILEESGTYMGGGKASRWSKRDMSFPLLLVLELGTDRSWERRHTL